MILGQFLGDEMDPALKEQMMGMVVNIFGEELDIDEVVQRIKDQKLTRKQRGMIYDGLADLFMEKQNEWLEKNSVNLNELEAALQLEIHHEILIRLAVLLVLPFTLVIWVLSFPTAILLGLLNLLTLCYFDRLRHAMVVAGICFQFSGSVSLSVALMFISPISGLLVLIYHTIRIAFTKQVRGQIYNAAQGPIRQLTRGLIKQMHYMHRRHQVGLKAFKHGPLGDGIDLYEGESEEDGDQEAQGWNDADAERDPWYKQPLSARTDESSPELFGKGGMLGGFLDYDGGNDVEDDELELVGSAAEAAEASENSSLLAHPQRKEGGGVGNRV
jgi:hypothetical protein